MNTIDVSDSSEGRLVERAKLVLCKQDTVALFRVYYGENAAESDELARWQESGSLSNEFRIWLAARLGQMTQDIPEKYKLALVAV